MPLQSRKYWFPEVDPALVPNLQPDYDFSARALLPGNAMFCTLFSAAAYTDDRFESLVKLRNPLRYAKFTVNTPLQCTLYATKEQGGYCTFSFSPTENNGDLGLQFAMSATKMQTGWSIPVSVLHGALVRVILAAGAGAWIGIETDGTKAVFTGHSLGGACAYLLARHADLNTRFKKFICTIGALKVSNGVEKSFVRALDQHLVREGDPVPDFPPPLFLSANPDFSPINGKSPLDWSKYTWNRDRWTIDGKGALNQPDDNSNPSGIDGGWPTLKLATKLATVTNHEISAYISAVSAIAGLTQFDAMKKAIY